MNDDIEELKAMIEPLKDWKFWEYSCTDEDVKKAMENKSYIEVVLEEQSKTIKELQQELQRKDNIINELKSHLESEISEWQDVSDEWTKAQVQEDKIILDKIKELEKK